MAKAVVSSTQFWEFAVAHPRTLDMPRRSSCICPREVVPFSTSTPRSMTNAYNAVGNETCAACANSITGYDLSSFGLPVNVQND